MRLNRLDLTRYGRFTDQTIDFGGPRRGMPDLHIVYGANEAGKSTALAAFLDLLFGIGAQSRFDFLHPYATMRIGAGLAIGGVAREFVRVKRTQGLFDGDEQPLPEATILGDLGGIDRAAYQAMFSLDDETLEAGGESILASKGDFGQLLFSASAGLSDLSRRLVALRAETDGFYKYRARSGELAALKERLAGLKAEREGIDTLAAHYAQLVETRDRAAAQYGEAIDQRGHIQARIEEIQRLLGALPRLVQLREIRARLLPLADLPAAPAGWSADLPGLLTDDIAFATEARSMGAAIAALAEAHDAIAVDATAAGLADRVARLADLRARFVTAEKDIPEHGLQLREATLAIAGILDRIERAGEPDPARLVLGASVVGPLRRLMESRSGVDQALVSAREERSKACRRLDAAKDRLDREGGSAADPAGREGRIAALAATLARLRGDDHGARRRLATRALAGHAETSAERLRLLRPWAGDLEQLVAMTVPGRETIARWKAESQEAQKRIDRHADEVERLANEALRVEVERDALDAGAGGPGDRDAIATRSAREGAWAVHRRTLDAASADAFEAALRRDDLASDARLGATAARAALHQATQRLQTLEVTKGRARARLDAAEAALQDIQDEVAAAMRAMTPALPATMSLAELEAWLGLRAQALEARRLGLDATRDRLEAEADAAAARTRLADALDAAGLPPAPDAGLEALTTAAQIHLERASEGKAMRDAVEDHRRDLEVRDQDCAKAAAADEAWTTAWTKACATCWLGADGATPDLATVREILDALAGLGPALETRAALADRIAKMEKDQLAFAVDVRAIAARLGMTETAGPILDLDQRVRDTVAAAAAALSDREAKAAMLADLQARQRSLAEKQGLHEARTATMTGYFGVASLTAVGERLRSAERKSDLEAQAEALTRDILDALRMPTIAAAEDALDQADRAGLEADLAAQRARFDDQDRRSRDLFSAHGKASDRVEAVGGDSAVAAIETQRRTIVLDIEDRALRYLRLRLGVAAAEQALRVYRDRHRSAMMARASDAFRTMSRGAYAGLATQPEKDGEILLAVGADGRSKVAHDLSKGTRFQLYLALRVAGYREFVAARPAVPFVADDIMETFDDFRAEATFRVLADMARVGQVIYLTHHRHLCAVARRVVPGVTIHELGETVTAVPDDTGIEVRLGRIG